MNRDTDMYKMTENFMYEFNGDFEKYLIDIGVEPEHIDKMKKKILQKDKDIYYEVVGDTKYEVELVPLEKVIGTSRGTVGSSVYENVRKMGIEERDWGRFARCFGFLQQMSLEELKESYQTSCYPVEMDYYSDEDEYYLGEDGNHRTLTAMLLGASHIRAVVTKKKCNYEMKEKYVRTEQFYQEYGITAIRKASFGIYEIEFEWDGQYYYVDGFEGQKEKEGCFEVIDKLEKQIESDLKIVKKIRKYSEKLRELMLRYMYNPRIKKYFEPMKKCDERLYPKDRLFLYRL